MYKQSLSFWSLLAHHAIEIPIIQRDYAQGRKGKEHLRVALLQSLKNALTLPDKTLTLDFVYGSEEGERFYPLDGQQRLTTLWLLHWYIAYQSGYLQQEHVRQQLKKFSYHTRLSSRIFCEQLCDWEAGDAAAFQNDHSDRGDLSRVTIGQAPKNMAQMIKDMTWYYTEWDYDPTIQSMLTMLSGTDTPLEDGIEKVFRYSSQQTLRTYWEKLTQPDCPIQFFYVPLTQFDLSDELYIKMNARGKPLTHFENLKADLINYINQKAQQSSSTAQENWQGLAKALHFDTYWTDIFWPARSQDHHIDEIYFTFLNRFFLSYRLPYLDSNHPYYQYFIDDTHIVYASLKDYQWSSSSACTPFIHSEDKEDDSSEGGIDYALLSSLKTILDEYYRRDQQCGGQLAQYLVSPWRDEQNQPFSFIPRYRQERHEVISITLPQRVVFYAICQFFLAFVAEEDEENYQRQLGRWMRFVWNLVSDYDEEGNPLIRSIEAMKKAIACIASVKIQPQESIYESLSNLLNVPQDAYQMSAVDRRFREEQEKAKQILLDNSLGKTYWETQILCAEQTMFKGGIHFLFHNEYGEVDWSQFEKKWQALNSFFDLSVSDVKSHFLNPSWLKTAQEKKVKKEYSVSLLKQFFSYFKDKTHEDVLLKGGKIFNNRVATWKYYLTHPALSWPVAKLLAGDINKLPSSFEYPSLIHQLVHTDLLEFTIVDHGVTDAMLRFYQNGNSMGLYPKNNPKQGVLLGKTYRDDTLRSCLELKVENNIRGINFFFGADIRFTYHHRHFEWNHDDYIYLLSSDGQYQKRQGTYDCISVRTPIPIEELLSALNHLGESIS